MEMQCWLGLVRITIIVVGGQSSAASMLFFTCSSHAKSVAAHVVGLIRPKTSLPPERQRPHQHQYHSPTHLFPPSRVAQPSNRSGLPRSVQTAIFCPCSEGVVGTSTVVRPAGSGLHGGCMTPRFRPLLYHDERNVGERTSIIESLRFNVS